MATLNEKELIKKVSQQTNQSEVLCQSIVDNLFDEIYSSLKEGDSVTLRNVGKFYVKPKAESWVFKFSPSQKWRKLFGWASTYKGDL